MSFVLKLSGLILFMLATIAAAQTTPVTFNTNFEDASLGTVEKLGENSFRCHVLGQYDERGRNRQANWYYFRMDHVKGRALTVTLTDFVGEYNDRPGAVAMNAAIHPVVSTDGRLWKTIDAMRWDDQRKETILSLKVDSDSLWIAHVVPYTTSDLHRLIEEVDRHPAALVETIGKSVNGRDLYLLTVTNPTINSSGKKVLWFIARQHAWETGTSYVMEGALRFITSEDPKAAELRDRFIFKFIPMMDPDGCATGKVRFNANGYDVNRHWDEVDLNNKEHLRLMPEIWYGKRAIFSWVDAGRPIDLMVNLHNTETNEYLETNATDEPNLKRIRKFYDLLTSQSSFDPPRPLVLTTEPVTTTDSLYAQKRIPVMLMEQRITPGKKFDHALMPDERRAFGRQLLECMSEAD